MGHTTTFEMFGQNLLEKSFTKSKDRIWFNWQSTGRRLTSINLVSSRHVHFEYHFSISSHVSRATCFFFLGGGSFHNFQVNNGKYMSTLPIAKPISPFHVLPESIYVAFSNPSPSPPSPWMAFSATSTGIECNLWYQHQGEA